MLHTDWHVAAASSSPHVPTPQPLPQFPRNPPSCNPATEGLCFSSTDGTSRTPSSYPFLLFGAKLVGKTDFVSLLVKRCSQLMHADCLTYG